MVRELDLMGFYTRRVLERYLDEDDATAQGVQKGKTSEPLLFLTPSALLSHSPHLQLFFFIRKNDSFEARKKSYHFWKSSRSLPIPFTNINISERDVGILNGPRSRILLFLSTESSFTLGRKLPLSS